MTRQRMSREARAEKILQTSLAVFLDKGFSKTSMTDIVQASGMSRGGVYHYYQNTSEILLDIMFQANEYRISIILDQLTKAASQAGTKFEINDAMADGIIDKFTAQNDYAKLYVMFLLEKHRDPKLEKLYQDLIAECVDSLDQSFESHFGLQIGPERFRFLTEFINSMLIASQVLEARQIFQSQRPVLKEMIKTMLAFDSKN